MQPAGTRARNFGATTVEFAIIATALLTILFAVIEFSRALFVVNTLTEATRRGARLATVCPIGDPKPARAAAFSASGAAGTIIPGLTSSNVVIEYLDADGSVVSSPAANFNAIRYVRVRIVNFQLPLVIPLLMPTVTLDGFATTVPRESLGVPRSGTVTSC